MRSAALLLTSVPKGFAGWVRLTGVVGAILFVITAARIFVREQVLPTSSPLPFFVYPFLIPALTGSSAFLGRNSFRSVVEDSAQGSL